MEQVALTWPLNASLLSTNTHLGTLTIVAIEMQSTEGAEKLLMQNCAFKYGISPRALLYYYSNFLRRAGIQCCFSTTFGDMEI